MLAMLISMIQTDDTEFQEYALKIDDYKKEIESTSNKSKNDFIDNARELMSNPFIIDKQMFNWCSKVDWGKLNGYIIFQIHQDLKPYLLDLKKNFTTYSMVNIMKLRGKYSPRLYEYFKMMWSEHKIYNKNKKNYTFELKIDWLRDFLKIGKGYRYNDIKTQIINKSKNDFRKFADIQFDYKEQKIGRRVDRLIVTIKDNTQGSNNYFTDLQTFKNFIRKTYKGKIGHFWMGMSKQKKLMLLGIDNKGYLYLQHNSDLINLTKDQIDYYYDLVFEAAKKSEIYKHFLVRGELLGKDEDEYLQTRKELNMDDFFEKSWQLIK